jgi:hypothetical protein
VTNFGMHCHQLQGYQSLHGVAVYICLYRAVCQDASGSAVSAPPWSVILQIVARPDAYMSVEKAVGNTRRATPTGSASGRQDCFIEKAECQCFLLHV